MGKKLLWNGHLVTGAIRTAGAKALEDAAEFLLDQANKTIPHQEGIMQDSGNTDVDADALEASIYYDTPYVVRQHQDTRLHHDEGRRAMWLALTLEEKQAKVQKYIADALRQALK